VRELADPAGVWRRLAERLEGRGVPSLEDALREVQLARSTARCAQPSLHRR